MNKVELLSPAGDLDKFIVALNYGADAVYLGGKQFGLRANSGNFDEKNMQKAVELAHEKGKKVYVTVNIFARNADFEEIKKYVISLEKIKVDAVIVSDLGVLNLVKENTKLPIHISTQANVLNKYTAMEYVKLGASRIILARECGFEEIKDIVKYVGNKCEIEVFVHGAMCVSYSGRCLLSNYLTPAGEKPRESNRGECCQPCRWKYALMEEKREGQYFEIEQDGRGSYILNSKDLCLVEHLDELVKAGVKCFKIEGRMKSEYYVGAVTNVYRRVLDGKMTGKQGLEELQKTAHREFTTGFVFGENRREFYKQTNPVSNSEFVGIVQPRRNGDVTAHIVLKGSFNVGDELEVLSPSENFNQKFTIRGLTVGGADGGERPVKKANQPMSLYAIECPFELKPLEMLRKKV